MRSAQQRRLGEPQGSACRDWLAVVALVIIVCGASTEVGSAAQSGGGSTTTAELVLRVVDSGGGPLASRCCVTDCYGVTHHPMPAEGCFYREGFGYFSSAFYSCGVCTLQVPMGAVTVAASRGFEYEAVLDTVQVSQDGSVVCTLSVRTDMAQLSWFSGDSHVHIDHTEGVYAVYPEDARFVAECEGLNVINCLDGDYCFTGGPDPCSTSERIVYMGQERRSRIYGHSALLGISSLVPPTSYTTWWPMIMDLADEVHEQPGALIVSAHPLSTLDVYDIDSQGGMMLAREVPIDVIGGKVDAYEVLSREGWNHVRNVDMWYHILNCGFRLPGCAGTDGCINADTGRPVGSYKSYVEVPEEFTFDSWLEGLAEGRTFVTNGPLVTEFNVDGLAMGDSTDIACGGSAEVSGSISVTCADPLLRADIMVNGEVDQTLFPSCDGRQIDGSFSVTLDGSSWVAARISGVNAHCFTSGDSLWAHTGPVYFTLNGRRIVEFESAEYLSTWVAQMETLALARGEWDAPSDSVRVMAELADARSYYETLADGALTGVPEDDLDGAVAQGESPVDAAIVGANHPNPFGASTAIPLYLSDETEATLQIIALSGRVVRTLTSGVLPEGWHSAAWDGRDGSGGQCASGIYFCRLVAGGSVATRKIVLLR